MEALAKGAAMNVADKIAVHYGDCLEVLPTLAADSLDSCVTDPPYGLQFMGREWDKLWRNSTIADQQYVASNAGQLSSRARKLPDFKVINAVQMQEWHTKWAREVYRVLKPGAHLLAFGGTRTYHLMACAIEDAGFEIRDCIMWLYGSGFPKSHDVSKGIDRATEFGMFNENDMRQKVGSNTKARSTSGKSALPTIGGET